MLATSREDLGVAGEQRVAPCDALGVPYLVPTSRRLQNASGAAVRRTSGSGAAELCGRRDQCDAVAEICRRFDGIPLAIELAAARVRSMGPDEIAGLFDERFRLLTGGRRRGVERHQTLRAAVEWSYALLDERGRMVFDRLGVFAGSFDADAATSVARGDEFTVVGCAGRAR